MSVLLLPIFATTVIVTTPTTIKNASAIVGGAPTTTVKVHAGGGNSTNMLASILVPQQVQISVGQSITWDNPSPYQNHILLHLY